jgi:hypothetical protein
MPGILRALSRLTFVIFAAGHFDRRIIPYNQPSGWTSEGYLAAPVTLAAPSMRLVVEPI